MTSKLESARPGDRWRVVLANPGAGNPFAYDLPANFVYRIESIHFIVTTDATAGNRLVTVQLRETAANEIAQVGALLQGASLAVEYDFIRGGAYPPNLQVRTGGPLPLDLILPAGGRILSNVVSMAAGDAITEIIISGQRWAV